MFRRRQNRIVSIGRERIDKAGISAVSQAERTMAGIFPFALSKPACIGFRKENTERRSRRTIVDFHIIENRSGSSRKYSRKKEKKKRKFSNNLVVSFSSEKQRVKNVFRFETIIFTRRNEVDREFSQRRILPSVSNIFYGFNHHVTVINRGAVRFSYFESKQSIEST